MSFRALGKEVGFKVLSLTGIDGLFRWHNRHRLLVVMYHGVTREHYDPPVWTQLPEAVFRRQLLFLRQHYQVISLSRLLAVLRGEAQLPERAALLTFDDGLRNNATVAYPLLRELQLPAAIFLTTGLIGSDRLLWFDELNLLLRALGGGRPLSKPRTFFPGFELPAGSVPAAAYPELAGRLKRQSPETRLLVLEGLRQEVGAGPLPYKEDFALLDWQQVRDLAVGGLVEFGTHTVNHRILTNLDDAVLASELLDSKATLTAQLGREVEAFCYPNGTPELDFTSGHQAVLRQLGFRCAFSTKEEIWNPSGDPLSVSRIGIGNDGTAKPDYFRLSTSGVLETLRHFAGCASKG